MDSRFKTVMWLLLFSFCAGLLLALFALVNGILKFVFSLGALYVGILYFRRQESVGMRIGFVVLSIVFFIIMTIVLTAIMYVQGKMGPTAP
jgi:hypothetical protein